MSMVSGNQQFDSGTIFLVNDRELLKMNFCQITDMVAAVQILADGLLLCESSIVWLK
jgi:hypothetical protein